MVLGGCTPTPWAGNGWDSHPSRRAGRLSFRAPSMPSRIANCELQIAIFANCNLLLNNIAEFACQQVLHRLGTGTPRHPAEGLRRAIRYGPCSRPAIPNRSSSRTRRRQSIPLRLLLVSSAHIDYRRNFVEILRFRKHPVRSL